ncbi:MAG TPA: M1 family aminopeptidase [Anaerolineaceae bacterium]|nr:M1 family aminopeptidase [Anaerolineaceae bacterium]
MRLRFFALLIASIVLLSSCAQPAKPPSDLPTPVAQITRPPEAATNPTPQAEPTNSTEPELPSLLEKRTVYNLDVNLDYAQHSASVVESITYFNRTDQPMSELLLLVPPRYFAGAYSQENLSGELVGQLRENGIQTMLSLKPALQPGASTQIQITFTLIFPNRQGVFGWSEMQTNLVDWFPIIPPFNPASGWQVNQRVVDSTNTIVGEYILADSADFNLRLRLTGSTQKLVIAASSKGVEVPGFIEYKLPLARSFSLSISDRFVVQEAQHQGVTILTYVFPQHRDAGEAIIEVAKNALDMFAELYYPYPRKTLSLVAADFLHNMETDGMLLISKGVIDFYRDAPLNNLTILIPHEISHQWLYSLVGNNPAREPWLDEAFATYSEGLYFERFHPDHLSWWWENRVDGFKPSGWVDSTTSIPGGYTAYRNAVYLNGARFLQSLRELVGDKAFMATLKQYAVENTYGIASGPDFFDAIRMNSDADLNPLLRQFFEDPPSF